MSLFKPTVIRFVPKDDRTDWVCPHCNTAHPGPKLTKRTNIFLVMEHIYRNHERVTCSNCRGSWKVDPTQLPDPLSIETENWEWAIVYRELVNPKPPLSS